MNQSRTALTNPTLSPPAAALPAAAPYAGAREQEIKLSEYIDILLDRKWQVAGFVLVALLVGLAYVVLATPVYQSNLLIQVEDSAPDAKGFLGDTANLFDVKTPAAGEIQILRSRMILGLAVDKTRLSIDAQPRYAPLVGRWLSRRATELSTPGFLGLAGYVTGNEVIDIDRFDVPSTMEDDTPFTITALGDGRYTLAHEDLPQALEGSVGRLLRHSDAGGTIALLVKTLDGKPGAQFRVSRASQLATIEDLQKRLQLAEQGKQSNVINVALEDTDRARLRDLLNEIGAQYVRQNVERKAAEAQKTLEFLDRQLPDFKQRMEASEDLYTRFRNKNGTVALDEEAKVVLGQSVELQTKLLEFQQRRRELAAKFTDINPKVETIDGQISAIQREMGGLNRRVNAMPTMQQDALRLERDVRVNGELYKSLLNNSLQLRLLKEGKIGNVRLLDQAATPKIPVKPQKPLIMALALALGLLGGAAFAIVRNLFSGGIRSPDEIESHTGLNVYSTIPFTNEQNHMEQQITSRKKGVHLLAVSHPTSPAVESLRSLRIALQFAALEANNNRILITGPTPGVGKSFVSGNFAAIMAAAGKKVLLIDADLRKGHIHQQFGLERDQGLSELIAGVLTMKQAIRIDVLPGLDLLTTGKLPPNAADMMLSDTFAKLLESLSAQYDLVIIDTPPVLVAADAAAVAPHAGVILLVARADVTQLGELNESAKRLGHAGIAMSGVLFNAMDMTRRHYGSGGYKYGGYRYTQYRYKA